MDVPPPGKPHLSQDTASPYRPPSSVGPIAVFGPLSAAGSPASGWRPFRTRPRMAARALTPRRGQAATTSATSDGSSPCTQCAHSGRAVVLWTCAEAPTGCGSAWLLKCPNALSCCGVAQKRAGFASPGAHSGFGSNLADPPVSTRDYLVSRGGVGGGYRWGTWGGRPGAGCLPKTERSSAVVRLFIFVADQLGQPLYNEVSVPLALRDPVWPLLSDNASNHDDRHANSSGTFELS